MGEQSLEVIALQLGRLASDIESEKRTRAAANQAVIDELKGLRIDMQKAFHGDGDSPGIIMRIDRLENKNITQEKFNKHEEENTKAFAQYHQDLVNLEIKLDDKITKVDNDRKNDKSFNKGAAVVISGLIIIVGIIISALQVFYTP